MLAFDLRPSSQGLCNTYSFSCIVERPISFVIGNVLNISNNKNGSLLESIKKMVEPTRNVAVTFAILPNGSLEN